MTPRPRVKRKPTTEWRLMFENGSFLSTAFATRGSAIVHKAVYLPGSEAKPVRVRVTVVPAKRGGRK